MPMVYDWARSARPTQPLTSGVWSGDWSSDDSLTSLERFQLTRSDVLSFHCYGDPKKLTANIAALSRYGRPLLCTEYMARPAGSTFAGCLPILKRHRVAAYNWGFVAGKTQTQYPWDSWRVQYDREPKLWFHEVLRPDGSPYKAAETKLIRKLTL
jgi:hypothetical protein